MRPTLNPPSLFLPESVDKSELISCPYCPPEERREMLPVRSSRSEGHIVTENHCLTSSLASHSGQSPQHLLSPVPQPKQVYLERLYYWWLPLISNIIYNKGKTVTC